MTYAVKEMFYSLQGEGAQVGRPAVFCRFAGCNLWNGREDDRHQAVCSFCDTDFVGTDGAGGGKFKSAAELAVTLASLWPTASGGGTPLVICTGGEPLLQLDEPLIKGLHHAGFEIAIETNGTICPPPGLDWICVSPKANEPMVVEAGDELKLVFPQPEAPPGRFVGAAFDHFWLQPMDGPDFADNTRQAVAYCLEHPRWRLSLQTHKLLGIR